MAYLCVSPGIGYQDGGKVEGEAGLGISSDLIATDNGERFLAVFCGGGHRVGKEYTVGIEGKRHRIRSVFRGICCFSKSLCKHLKAFDMFFYINYGFI
jgi:hypothetical protein